jgi:S-adenosyl-L-methionine hydrolase (adenosine-forming)
MTTTIALLTDFGDGDVYVGVMRGVITGITPQANLVDITHQVEPQHVRQAAFFLMNAYSYFPAGTVFLVIIDPGVGSARLPVVVQAGDYTFIAPDNGVLSYALQLIGDHNAYVLENSDYRLENISQTFHGRDVFSPAAAHIAAGVSASAMGPQVETLVQLPLPMIDARRGRLTGEILHVDRFGNIITSIGHLHWLTKARLRFQSAFTTELPELPVSAVDAVTVIGDQRIMGVCGSYSESIRGELLALVGSSGYLEIAVNQGSAAERLEVSVGDLVDLEVGDVDAAIRD